MNIKKEFEKLWQYEMDLIDNPVNFTYMHKMCLRINKELLDKQKEEIWDKVTDILISSLPSNAENLSTLTGWQAQEVVKNFLDKLNK